MDYRKRRAVVHFWSPLVATVVFLVACFVCMPAIVEFMYAKVGHAENLAIAQAVMLVRFVLLFMFFRAMEQFHRLWHNVYSLEVHDPVRPR